jgi:hypothetical protein
MVPRQSATRPRGLGRVRRLASGCTGRASFAIARRASACSAADICSKSSRFSRSSAEKVSVASNSTSSPSVSRGPGGFSAPSTSASAARRCLRRRRRHRAAHGGQEQAHHLLHEPRIAPEQPEDLRKHRPMLRPRDQARLERRIEIPPVAETHRFHRPDCVDHPARSRRHPGRPERAREMHDVLGQLAVLAHRQIGEPGHQPASAASAASSTRFASDPCRRAMSS